MYCSNCGRELCDGEVCSCTQPAPTNENAAASIEASAKAKDKYDLNKLFIAVVSVFTLMWEIIKKPCSTVQAFMNRDNGKMGVKLMLVKAGLLCIYVLMYFSFSQKLISLNRIGLIITVFAVSFALDFIFACVISLCVKIICKTEIRTTSAMEIAGLRAAMDAAGIIAAALCSVFFPVLSFAFIAAGSLFGLIVSYTATLQLANIDKDKRVYVYMSAFIIMILISILVLTVVSGGLLVNYIKDIGFHY